MKEDDENDNSGSPEEPSSSSDAMMPTDNATNPAEPDSEEDEAEMPKRKKSRVPKLYPGARKDLYPTCNLMWDSYLENLPPFFDFSQSYTEELGDARKLLVKTVQALPDETSRNEPHVNERGLAEKAALEYCDGWQLLKRYIIRTKFSSETAKLNLAGQKLYEPARGFEWSNVQALIVAADNFTESHFDELTANLNMPSTFPAQLTTLGEHFNTILTRFRNFEKITEELTDQKMTAENDLYKKTIEMGQDGQEIFKKTPAKARLFSYNAMLETVSGVGSASLVGTLTDEVTNQPVGNATVSILYKDLNATSTEQGKYSIKRLSSGSYTVSVSAPGYESTTISGVAVEPATAKRLNVKLRKTV